MRAALRAQKIAEAKEQRPKAALSCPLPRGVGFTQKRGIPYGGRKNAHARRRAR